MPVKIRFLTYEQSIRTAEKTKMANRRKNAAPIVGEKQRVAGKSK